MSQFLLKQIKKIRAWKKPGNVEFPGFLRRFEVSINASRTEALYGLLSTRTEQISNSETLDITGFRAMAVFFVSAINYFFFLVTAPSLPRTLI